MIPSAQSESTFGGQSIAGQLATQATARAFNAPRLGQQSQVQPAQPAASQYAPPGVAAQSAQHAQLGQQAMQARLAPQAGLATSTASLDAQRQPLPPQQLQAGGGQPDFSHIADTQARVDSFIQNMPGNRAQQNGLGQQVTNNYGPGNPGSQRQSFELVPPVSGLQASVAPEMENQVGFTSSNPANAAARVQNLYQDRRAGNGNGGGQYE
jgi:hypothetical protein